MAPVFPTFYFQEEESTFNELVFEVKGHDYARDYVKLTIDLITKETTIIGLGHCENNKYLPAIFYKLSDEQQEKLRSSEYKDHVGGMFTMFIHGRVLRILGYSNKYSYADFVSWLREGLLNIDHMEA